MDAIRAALTVHPRHAALAEGRQRMDGLAAQFPLGPDIEVQPVNAGSVAAEWTASPHVDPTWIVTFLHGGGYVTGSLRSHRHMVAQAGRKAQATTFAARYRLALEHPFPAAQKDAVEADRFLLAQPSPARIALAGEEARGGLALAMLTSLRA
ncbi:alpha/beta hydrolase fold domain-containing protein [Mesorhizobium sp. B2-6-4]|uniref:alpha/beta hydrolase fold domain-containing protein n=1 Tax=Mesorhizobium sp. B2-6-4 TaxID=2589913 RepID=UPI001FF02F86|nr:alpha/beta hydrolase fold domain-containing protein [Mesorhizobium sp. B2-6-4]